MTQELLQNITMTPVAANVINKNRFVAVVTAGEVDESIAAGDSIGVSQEASAAASATPIPVAILNGGKVDVEAGAIVTVGARVMSDATGRAITATGATARVLGIALNTTGAAGEMITVLASKAAGEFVA
ncbi:capsid cement protein [uncultured Paraglaciecola sp.]|uniref:capsid cement protein n=1 Tax=uncultured Paraglaciecola sp. TaxID=1765024 RepID=UPI00260941A4|nr:capsid cement protein [uncultured Paraglaciecola sp.]